MSTEKESPYHETYTGPDEKVCEHCGTPLFYYVNDQSVREHDHLPNSIQCQRVANAHKAAKYDALVKENDDLKKENDKLGKHIHKMAIDRITPPPQRNHFQMQQQYTQKEIWMKQNDIRYGVKHI